MKILPALEGHYPWLAERANLVISPGFRAIECVDDQGKIVGMVGFDGWMPNSVSLHVAVEKPMALRLLAVHGFGLAFNKLNKGVVIAPVLANNEKSLKLVMALGFKPAGYIKDAWAPGVDIYLFQMRREECRFLDPKEIERWAA